MQQKSSIIQAADDLVQSIAELGELLTDPAEREALARVNDRLGDLLVTLTRELEQRARGVPGVS
jgi:hypothetical protein